LRFFSWGRPKRCKAALDAANATEAAAKKKTDDAKNLKTALGGTIDGSFTFTPTLIGDVDGGGSIVGITLKKQSTTVSPLGGWTGVDYKGDEGTAPNKNTGEARLYTNQGAGKSVSFAEGSGLISRGGANAGTYTIATGNAADIGGFPSVGQQTYDNEDEVTGTFKGVSGTYTCGADECTSTPAANGGFTLPSDWTFKPVAGATLRDTASDYLYFGWWVRKDKDGKPTHAQSAYGEVDSATNLTPFTGINDTKLIGEATYVGKAAGKFAVSDPLSTERNDSGHFTADAMLKANFKTTASTLEGTIDEFRLNDSTTDAGWKVMLKEASFVSNKWALGGNEGTEWHVGEAKGGASGSWEAQMYTGDNEDNTTPADVIGLFHSAIGGTHEMRGAFGAELEK